MHVWVACLLAAALARGADASAARDARSPAPDAAPRVWASDQRIAEPEPPTRGFRPLVGVIVSRSGLSAGVGYRYDKIGGTPVGGEAAAMWSVRGYQLYLARVGLLESRRDTLELRPPDGSAALMFNHAAVKRPGIALYADLRYRSYPRHTFYGIGDRSRREDRSTYKLRGGSYELVGQWQPRQPFGVSIRVGVLESIISPRRGDPDWPSVDERFDPLTVPGFLEHPRYATIGLGAAFDRRDSPRDPTRGSFVGASYWRYEAAGRAFDFTRAAIDARAYVPPARLPGVLALRLLVSADGTAPGAHVPFFLQQTLGGGETLRGYPSHRWRDRALAHATVEYRWHPHPLVEIAPFVDVGTVASRVGGLSLARSLASYGIGLRGHWRGRAIGRLDWAHSPEGHRIVLSTGPIF